MMQCKERRSGSPNRPLKQKSSNAVVRILIYNPISAHTGQMNSHSAMLISLKIISWHSLWGAFNSDLRPPHPHQKMWLLWHTPEGVIVWHQHTDAAITADNRCVLCPRRRIFQDSLMKDVNENIYFKYKYFEALLMSLIM